MTDPMNLEQRAESLANRFAEISTHILWYHDKEGRTTNEQVIPKARFKEMAEIALSFTQESERELVVALEIASRQFRHAKNGNSPDGKCIDGCAMCSVQYALTAHQRRNGGRV